MKIYYCTCGATGPWYIVEVTEDYITLRCAMCEHEFAVTAGADLEK